jgi:predicted metal-dependent phosphotriesterase family hydrolase
MHIMTVTGPVDAASVVGSVLVYEHVLCEAGARYPTQDARPVDTGKLCLENLRVARQWPWLVPSCLRLDSIHDAAHALIAFRESGGGLVVDCTPTTQGRNPAGLRRVSELSKVHIVMGASVPSADAGAEAICGELVRQLALGAADAAPGANSVRAGIIGELAVSAWPLTEADAAVLRGAGLAQAATGAPVLVNLGACPPNRQGEAAAQCAHLLQGVGGDPRRLIVAGLENFLLAPAAAEEVAPLTALLAMGVSVMCSGFGLGAVLSLDGSDAPTDADLARAAAAAAEAAAAVTSAAGASVTATPGLAGPVWSAGSVFVGNDVHMKLQLPCYGGFGYGHACDPAGPVAKRLQGHGLDGAELAACLAGRRALDMLAWWQPPPRVEVAEHASR